MQYIAKGRNLSTSTVAVKAALLTFDGVHELRGDDDLVEDRVAAAH